MMSSNREKLLVVNSMEPSVYCTPIHSEFTVYIHSEFTVIHSELTVYIHSEFTVIHSELTVFTLSLLLFTLSLLYSP